MFENSVNTWHVVTIGLALTSNIQVERILELEAELRIPVADPKKHQKLQEKLEQILEKDDTPKEAVLIDFMFLKPGWFGTVPRQTRAGRGTGTGAERGAPATGIRSPAAPGAAAASARTAAAACTEGQRL